jgi:hypothetical protein
VSNSNADTSVDGRVFRSTTTSERGDVGGETYFHFDQSDDVVHARYEGGDVRLGHLVGRHFGDSLDFRYVHLTVTGKTATGRSVDRIERLDDGRLRLHEEWERDSKSRSGTSVLEELTDATSREFASE